MRAFKILILFLTLGIPHIAAASTPTTLENIAERYVKTILAIGAHEPGYVDAYYGPEAWQVEVQKNTPSLPVLEQETATLLMALKPYTQAGTQAGTQTISASEQQRARFLEKQLIAAQARTRMLQGQQYSFDEETRLLFDAVVPPIRTEELEQALADLSALIEGQGSLQERFVAFRNQFQIPWERLAAVFDAAIKECRDRTAAQMELPTGETFTREFVNDKPWSGYNWYKGNAVSLIQVNTDLPSLIDDAVDLGCHEGYPGHHVFNAMLESNLVKKRGWIEFSVYPLYSPQSLLAEGTASFARHMAFPANEQTEFETSILYPLAGLDPTKAESFANALAAMSALRYARIEGARRYLDGNISREELITWLARYQLTSRERAEQGVRFIETYRGYVINYTLGSDLTAAYVTRRGGTDHTARWDAYKILLSTPLTASMIRE